MPAMASRETSCGGGRPPAVQQLVQAEDERREEDRGELGGVLVCDRGEASWIGAARQVCQDARGRRGGRGCRIGPKERSDDDRIVDDYVSHQESDHSELDQRLELTLGGVGVDSPREAQDRPPHVRPARERQGSRD